jgi:ribosome-associated protein
MNESDASSRPIDAARPSAPERLDAQTFAAHIARLLADSNCQDVLVLDLRGLSSITDYFVIASGASERQVHSVAQELADLAAIDGVSGPRLQGGQGARWIVADFIDIMVHLFESQLRPYYDLESLWAEAPKVKWHAMTTPGQFTEALAARKHRR